jgi:hypothetical protein
MPNAYTALRRLKVGDRTYEPGEFVPVDRTWKTVRELVDGGYLSALASPDTVGNDLDKQHDFTRTNGEPGGAPIPNATPGEMAMRIEELSGRVVELEAEIRVLRGESTGTPASTSQGQGTAPSGASGGATTSTTQEISTDYNVAAHSVEEVGDFAVANPELITALIDQEQKQSKPRKTLIALLKELNDAQ